MAKSRPKLRISPPPGVDPRELRRLLGDRFELEFLPPTPDGPAPPNNGPAHADLLDSIGLGLALVSVRGEVLRSNRVFAALSAEVTSRIQGICRDAAALLNATPDGEERVELIRRFEINSADKPRWYEVRVWPTTPPGGDRGMSISVHDVTRAGLAEQKFAAVERAGRELVRLEADAIRKMNMVERLTLLENKIIRYAHSLLSFDHFAVRLIDERTGKLELVLSCGLSPEAREFDLYPRAEGNGLAGRAAATGQTIRCPDASKEEHFLPAFAGAQSSLVVPLRLHDKVIGVLDVESVELDAFSADDQRFAEIFSAYIALALHMLDLLVVERIATNETVTGRVAGELDEPLDDILRETEVLDNAARKDPDVARHLAQIKDDVNAIKSRVRDAASGPQTLLGVDRALRERRKDPALVGKHILVADDAANVRRIITDVLRNRGALVTACENGQVAIEALNQPQGHPFDLVLSDIKMPDRNGYEVFAAARRLREDLPVILMTGFGYDPNHSIVRASQEGLQSVLFKPIQVERLLDEVKAAIHHAASTRS